MSDCNGICLTGSDIGIPSNEVAYAHPGCPEHGDPHDFQLGHADKVGRLICGRCREYQTEHGDQATPSLLLLEAEREALHGYYDESARLHLSAKAVAAARAVMGGAS
jgi:hypothetical protein